MQCLSPISIINPKEGNRMAVPCGKCYPCLSNLRNQWTFGLQQEEKNSVSSFFITLTYDDEHTDGNVWKRDIQLFFKRYRKKIHPTKLKYFITSEYGSKTFRPHYHLLLFFRIAVSTDKVYMDILNTWQLGQIHIASVTDASIHYCTKYHISKFNVVDGLNKTFTLMSRNPAIGSDYVFNQKNYHKHNVNRAYVTHPNGLKGTLPRYYKDKLYTDLEKKIIGAKGKLSTKDFLDEKKYFELNPKHSFSDFCRYRQEYMEQISQKAIKLNQKDKL